MDLSAEGIAGASFDEVDGGLDPSQVRAFLSIVGDHVAALERRVAESDQMRAATMELLEQAEALVDDARARAEAAEYAGSVQRIEEAEREAEQILAAAEARAAAETFISFELLADEAHELRRAAERKQAMAAVEATRIVADAEDRAERILRGVPDETVARPDDAVAAIVAEAEELLEEARERAERMVTEASARATDLKTRADLSEAVRRAVRAVQAVAAARGEGSDEDLVGEVRGRAVQLLAEARRSDTRLAPARRAALLDQLAELQEIVGRIESRLMGRTEPAESRDDLDVVVDLTDDALEADLDTPDRPSRYQQRSANLPTIGTDVDDVSRAVHSMRRQLHEERDE